MLISVTVPLLKSISGSFNLELPQEPVNDQVRASVLIQIDGHMLT